MSNAAAAIQDEVSLGESTSVELTVEIGQTSLERSAIDQLRPGALIALDEFSADPVTIYAGSKLVGRGEILLIDGQFGVRITELYRSTAPPA